MKIGYNTNIKHLYKEIRTMKAIDKHNEFVCISYGSGYVELFMTLEQVESIATIGENDLAVKEVLKDLIIKKQFKRYSDEIIEKAFKDIGIDEQDKTFTREEQEQYILWCMAWTHIDDDPEDYKTYPRECVVDYLIMQSYKDNKKNVQRNKNERR